MLSKDGHRPATEAGRRRPAIPAATTRSPGPAPLGPHSAVTTLQQTAGNGAVQRLLTTGPAPAIQRDQRTGTALPTAAQQGDIQNELNPTVPTVLGAAPPAWDGAAVGGRLSSAAVNARTALAAEVTAAMNLHLTNEAAGLAAMKATPKVPMTSLEGAGRAAKQVVDAQFGAWASAAALTRPQAHTRAAHQFRASGPRQNLFDATNADERKRAGQPLNPNDLADWIAASDGGAQTAQAAHHFNPLRSAAEATFLAERILRPFIAANRRALLEYDLYGFGMADPLTGRIVTPGRITNSLSNAPGAGGDSSPALRASQWSTWKTLIHEYIHTLEHPNSRAAGAGNRVILEGFCEMFTKDVVVPAVATAAGNVALIDEVEGRHNGVPPTATIIGSYATPATYVDYLAHAEQIRDVVLGGGAGGANAVRASFFQGHVEFLGLTPTGAASTPAVAGSTDVVSVPAGVTTLGALATATGVSATDIVSDNATRGVTVTPTGPLPPRLRVHGCREHVVVVAADLAGNQKAETKDDIAAQNGVTTTDLDRANPAVTWPALTAGQQVLIPFH
jgi:hypothetical protein